MAENKMAEVAKLFSKKLGERFKVKRDNEVFDCAITRYGIYCFSVYENPYIDLNAFVLYDLLTGEAVIVDD
jgi:hypothetical protein